MATQQQTLQQLQNEKTLADQEKEEVLKLILELEAFLDAGQDKVDRLIKEGKSQEAANTQVAIVNARAELRDAFDLMVVAQKEEVKLDLEISKITGKVDDDLKSALGPELSAKAEILLKTDPEAYNKEILALYDATAQVQVNAIRKQLLLTDFGDLNAEANPLDPSTYILLNEKGMQEFATWVDSADKQFDAELQAKATAAFNKYPKLAPPVPKDDTVSDALNIALLSGVIAGAATAISQNKIANVPTPISGNPAGYGTEDFNPGVTDATSDQIADLEDAEAGARMAALAAQAQAQQTIAEQRGNKNNADWRVRLRLAPLADYLYMSQEPGILGPLKATDGVLFPYTPTIQTTYKANYSTADITHSNYRGYFYQGSVVEPVTITCPFTAQGTAEAEYLLAVIHFFKSVTKMFYGQDPQRGSPPPVVYLSGLGQFQYNEHPCVVTSFTYDLPADVDYIRAYSPNVNNSNMLPQRQSTNSQVGLLGKVLSPQVARLLNSPVINPAVGAVVGNLFSLPKSGQMPKPAPQTLGASTQPTYVPTKMTMSITLLPIISRQAQSQKFSLRQYANGDLLKGGMW